MTRPGALPQRVLGVVCGLVTMAAAPMSVSVTPDGTSVTQPASSGPFYATFFVKNTGTNGDSYDILCYGRVNITCDETDISYVTLDPGEQIDVAATYYTQATTGLGRVVLKALGAATDTGYYRVTVTSSGTPGKPGVALRNHNGDHRDRSLCLTSGAGQAAAWQCGDLLVSQGLPGYSTTGRERSLTLVYSSAQAVPRPTVVAWVTRPTSVSQPDSVYTELKVNGLTRASAWYYPITGTKQVALAYDAANDSSGVYPISLTVRHKYASGVHDSTVYDTVLVVNRSQSRFGTGWHLAGVEQLRTNQPGNKVLWIGGDGSAKVYRNVGTNVWLAAVGAFRDTLRYDPGTATYTRTLRHSVQVKFDAKGRHLQTVNRVGHTTAFAWTWNAGASDTVLSSITVPPGGSGTVYTLTYAAGKLDYLTDPTGRVLNATVTSSRMVSLTDPDNGVTGFGYDASGRMTSRTNRRNYTTWYTYAKGLRVTLVKVPLNPATADTAATQFAPWDEQGFAFGSGKQTAADTTASKTQMFGPRVGVADDATFWVDRWGAPTRIQDALGGLTYITRGDPAVPALATRLKTPDGRITGSTYGAQRANLVTSTDSTYQGTQGTGATQVVTTSYVYGDSRFPDAPTQVRGPVDTVSVTYDTLGLPSLYTAQGGHQTGFVYFPSGTKRGLLSTVTEYAVPVVDTVAWTEANANLVASFDYDALGNLTWMQSPKGLTTVYTRDAYTRVRYVTDPTGHRTDYAYSVLNQTDTVTVYDDAQLNGQKKVRYRYTASGLVDRIVDVARGVTREWGYDAADRVILAIDDAGSRDSTYYNAGSLVDSVRTRTGHVIRHTYDVAGRVTQTIYPANTFMPNSSVPGDTIVRMYDTVGRLLTASSRNAIDSIWYNLEGSVRTERQIVRGDDKSITFQDTLRYWYDVGGRRTKFYNGTDTLRYTYGANGLLAKLKVDWMVGGLAADSFLFTWDALGRRDRVQYANGTDVTFGYDRDGHLRMLCSKHTGGDAGGLDYLEQRLRYERLDADGHATNMSRRQGMSEGSSCAQYSGNQPELFTNSAYDGRHQLLTRSGLQNESYQYDGSGNITSKTIGASQSSYVIASGTNRLLSGTINGLNFTYSHDPSGNRVKDTTGVAVTNTRKYFYNAIGRMVGDSAYWDNGMGFQWLGSLNMFRYDARGRRVKAQSGPSIYLLYDGDNVVRAGGSVGEWRYIQGPGLDDPLVAAYSVCCNTWTRYYYLTDGRGRQMAFTDAAGYDQQQSLAYTRDGGSQAGGIASSNGFENARSGSPDAPRLSFYRNRYYDQETGRWAQEDPIGVAGGINLFRYAGNNPATFTDPFGLKEECPECEKESLGDRAIAALKQKVGRVIGRLTGGGLAAVDRARDKQPGTTQGDVANVALNPPDPGRVDLSVTGYAGPVSGTAGTGGMNFGLSPSLTFGATADATYTAPNAPSGIPASLGWMSGEGVIGGGSVNTQGGRVTGITGSVGVGFTVPIPGQVVPTLLQNVNLGLRSTP